MNVKKKCVAILTIVIAAMAVWGIVVTVKCADNNLAVVEQEQPGFNDDKIKVITHQQYVNDALDPNAIYVVKEDWIAGGNGEGYVENCDCGHDYITYRENIPTGMVVTSYFVLDNKHEYEVLARFDYIGGQLVDVR